MANIILSEEEYNELKKNSDSWRDRYYEVRYALRKDEQLDESISCVRDIPSDVEMIEDLKKRAADSDYYKEKSELLEEKLKKANELADSWKRDYEFVRDRLIHPIYDILYPDNPNRDINVTDFINNVKDLKVYADENGGMYKEIQEWREKCIARGIDVDRLLKESENKDKKISELEKEKSAHLEDIECLKKSNEKLQNQVMKSEKSCDKIPFLRHELEMDKLRRKIHELEKEKADHLKGIERLKKSQEKLQNQVKNLQTTNEESYKREEKLEDKCHRLERRLLDENKRFSRLSIERGIDVDHLLSLNKKLDEKISELESSRDAWSNTATARAEQVIEVTKDRDNWRKLYNSLSETCADYDKRCKEECEKKYRDEISKLQNIVTEKHVEIKGLKKEIINLTFDRATVKDIMKKNTKLNQAISDQEVTIKALLITIKEMCKEENENA